MRQVLGPGALGRPRGIGWRGRWEGGSGWGIHVNPWLIRVNVWQKPLQYCGVIGLQLVEINGKNKNKNKQTNKKNWCCWIVVQKKIIESRLDCKEIQPVHLKGDQSWVFIGRTDAEIKTLILWSPHMKTWLIGKDPYAGWDWGWENKGMTEDEMTGWHHWLNGYEFEWTPGVGDGQGGLACCDSWGRKESDTTERLNWTELNLV